MPGPSATARSRRDRCPGVLRPWPAEDGGLVRVRLVGGRVPAHALRALGEVAAAFGDGDLHLTSRANLQLRGLPLGAHGVLPDDVVAAIEATGLLPSRRHDLARNVMISPATGLAGGRADLRPVAAELDRLLLADPALGALPGRFVLVLDDGRGDLVDVTDLVRRGPDLGLVALDETTAQLRHGADGWGETVALADAPAALADLARTFLDRRGAGASAAWHVDELAAPLRPDRPRDPRTRVRSEPLPHGPTPAGRHVAVPDGVLGPDLLRTLVPTPDPAPDPAFDPAVDPAVEPAPGDLVVTPWRGILVPIHQESR